jgi:hypothetical protein
MPSASPDDTQVAELLVFNSAGKVLSAVSAKDGTKVLPQVKLAHENSGLTDSVVSLGISMGMYPTKIAPIYGLQKNGIYRVTFLIQSIDLGPGISIPGALGADKLVWSDLVSLCTKEVSPEHEYYRTMLSTVLAHIFPTVPV